MPKIYLYAEILTHLRQLTLHASLQSEKNEETKVDISSDKKIITVHHDGESASLYLPTQISGTAKVTFPLDKRTEISARVQIDDLEQWKDTDAAGIEAPWNASELSSTTAMQCVECGFNVLPTNTISSWKDLPNQHWADVMDLWFCHKPHDHHDHDQGTDAAKAKGFSSQSKLVSTPGIGLVDLVSFALHPDDCKIEQIKPDENGNAFKPIAVHCLQCKSQLGMFSINDQLVRLDKTRLGVRTTTVSPFETYPPTTFVAAQLLELIESTATRKVIVYSQSPETSPKSTASDLQKPSTQPKSTSIPAGQDTDPKDEDRESQIPSRTEAETEPHPLLLWIFNPDIYYSSSRLITDPLTSTTHNSTPHSSSISNPESSPFTLTTSATPTPTPTSPTTAPSPSQPKSPPPLPRSHHHIPTRALKIFYRALPPSELQAYLSLSPSTATPTHPNQHHLQQYEPLPLPLPTLTSVTLSLQNSTSLLPASARTFTSPSPSTTASANAAAKANETWQIGLLGRYERRPTASKIMAQNPLARRLMGRGTIASDGRPVVTRWEVEMPEGAGALYE